LSCQFELFCFIIPYINDLVNSLDQDRLFEEILAARERVYALGDVTPLQPLVLPGSSCEVWVKREDLGPIKAYKWRGAYNAMAALSAEQRSKGIVTASAGNHAQGVAYASSKANAKSTIVMPENSPLIKIEAAKGYGTDVILKGTRVDGIYTADPEKDSSATKYKEITFEEVYDKGLNVMDMTAFTLCQENNLPIIVFDMNKPGNLFKLVQGEEVGTLIT